MNREEWESEYEGIRETPLSWELELHGFTADEIESIPARTLGELPSIDLYGVIDSLESSNPNNDVEESLKFEGLQYLTMKMRILPRLAEHALNGEWDSFCSLGTHPDVMPDAFEYFYDDMPDEYRRDFAILCYQLRGDSLESCREAVEDLPRRGRDELPEECRGLDELTVYRAGEEPIDEAGERLSWTLDEKVARFFKNRIPTQDRHLYRAHIRPRDVIAYTDEREEREVIQYMDVYDVEEVEA